MALVKCRNCGVEISDDSKKCVHCGAQVVLTVRCKECKKEYDNTTNICPFCGKKNSNNIKNSIISVKSKVKEKFVSNKKKVIVVSIVLVIVLVLGFVGFKMIPKLFISSTEYLENGDYQNAYKKAKNDSEKEAVLFENLLATISYEVADGLKDPSSFNLSHVYYDKGKDEIVLEVVAKNSYGGNVTNYYDYEYDDDDNKYSLYCYLSSLEEESYKSYDTSSEKIEKAFKNIVRGRVSSMMKSKDKKVDDKMVDRINKLFKEKKLRDIELMNEVVILYPDSGDNI